MTKEFENKNKKSRPFLVIELLNSFSKRELAHLSDFVSCNYHNTDVHVVNLLDILRKEVIHREKKFDDVVQSVVYRATFPKKAIPRKVLSSPEKKLLLAKMTLLTRLAEAFLSYEALKENPACKAELLYGQLLGRNQFWLFNRHVTKDTKALEAKTAKGVNEYEHQFKMQYQILNYLHQKGLVTDEDNLPELLQNLDIYYLLNRLQLYGTCISLMQFSAKKSYNFESMEVAMSLLKLPQYMNHPLLRIHQVALDLLKNSDESSYIKLTEFLHTYQSFIPANDLNNFYKIAISFCAIKIIEGDSTYYRRSFDLYQSMDDKNLLIEGNFIPIIKLKNIITVSCKVGEFEWAEATIEKYRPNLEKVHAKNVYHFNMGAVAFYQNDFKNAISHFIRVEKINLAYDIDCRIMLLKSHYELDKEYDERTIRILKGSERFIQDHKGLIPSDKKAYKNFVRILINIYNTRHHTGKMTPEKIQRKLEKLELVSDKQWLEKKSGELE